MNTDVSTVVIGDRAFQQCLKRYLEPSNTAYCHGVLHTDVLATLRHSTAQVVIVSAELIHQGLGQVLATALPRAIYCLGVEIQANLTASDRPREILTQAALLRQGADAYLRLTAAGASELFLAEQQLLLAQLTAAQRWLKHQDELIQANDFLSSIALADPLTELSNRRALEWELPRQTQRAFAQHQPFSLLILDVDFFKGVNDAYGHVVGDRVLQRLAQRFRSYLRNQDVIFRYGGEEFVVLLKQADANTAQDVAQRLRCLVAEQPFHVENDLTLTITISVGAATLQPDDDPEGKSLLNRADQGLLQAKVWGRNQVVNQNLKPRPNCDR
ncbi:GGDEF domain-containing protein [Spirulina major]|uniref:GGDEF domain-containing protein n=1 Tax=Spirulina major TaxID=270636 RepID=UPI000933DE4D|nr:GGDEF domain-containing protein [Spirulina major]